MSGANDLRFIGTEFHKRGGRGVRECSISKLEAGGNRWKVRDTDDLRNEFCWEVLYL